MGEELVIVKFGGSILREGSNYLEAARHVGNLLREGRKVIVVVSAMKGVTNALIDIAESKRSSKNIDFIAELHRRTVQEITGDDSYLLEVERILEELAKTAKAIEILGEVTPRVRDLLLSFGERLSAILMHAALDKSGIESTWLTGWDAGIVSDDSFGEAKPIHELSSKLVKGKLQPLLAKNIVPVVTGFIAGTLDGVVTTLGRGGSDYTATLLAKYLDADEVRLYTDVPGVMTADPRLVPNAKTIPYLSFREAMELSHLGAKRFHPRTFEPLRGTRIRVRVLGFKDSGEGTIIGEGRGGPPLKAVAMLLGLSIVCVEGAGMVGRLGTAAEIMGITAREDINIIGILQPLSELTISLVIDKKYSAKLVNSLKPLVSQGIVRDIVSEDIIAASIVGDGIRDPEVLSQLLNNVIRGSLHMIAWHKNDTSITLIFRDEDPAIIANLLHEEVMKYNG